MLCLLQVTIVTGKSRPGDAHPFEETYTKSPSNGMANGYALKGAALVLRVPWTSDSWAIVVNTEGPAEW